MGIVVCASALRSGGLFVHDMWRFQEFLGGDLVTHFLMGGAVMVAGFLVALPRSVLRTASLALAVVALLFLEEISQLAIDTREFNWLDFGMGAAGALLTTVILSSFYLVSRQLMDTETSSKDDIKR
jgi:hypothetical protein